VLLSDGRTATGTVPSASRRRREPAAWPVTGAVLLIAALALALRCIGFTAPWAADNFGTAGGFFSIAARNHLRYGYAATHLLPVVTAEGPPSPAVYYTNHPPLFELLVSASFGLFGVHEWAARLVPLVFSLVSLGLLVHLARRFYGDRVALLTLMIAATLPLEAHLATHVDVQGSVLLALVLATVTCLASRRYAAAVACFTLAAGVDWPALYLPVLLAVVPWPFDPRRPRWLTAGLLVYAGILFVVLASWLSGPHAILSLLHDRALAFRSDQGRPFDLAGWIHLVVGTYLWELCTPAVLVALVIWSVWRVPALVHRPHPERLALLLLLFGVMHMIVGFQGAYQHEFWATYLRAGVPLVVAILLERVAVAFAPGWRRTAVLAMGLILVCVPGLLGTLRLAGRPISTRMLDADYTPRELAEAIRSCTPRGSGAITSDYYGESATFFYADRPLAIGVVTVDGLTAKLRRPRYDPPAQSGSSYEVPSAAPVCFVMPRLHERYFPDLAAHLRGHYRLQDDPKFDIFVIGSEKGPDV
jgi:4-amino-4-deoxy-L-arabinose transferase-like glycosyltransferase